MPEVDVENRKLTAVVGFARNAGFVVCDFSKQIEQLCEFNEGKLEKL